MQVIISHQYTFWDRVACSLPHQKASHRGTSAPDSRAGRLCRSRSQSGRGSWSGSDSGSGAREHPGAQHSPSTPVKRGQLAGARSRDPCTARCCGRISVRSWLKRCAQLSGERLGWSRGHHGWECLCGKQTDAAAAAAPYRDR
eukprot:3842758-Rhodomonas_salina.2